MPQTEEEVEICEVLDLASNRDLMEIANILGVQFQTDCFAEELNLYPDPPNNEADVDDIIDRIEANEAGLTAVNLNNIKNIDGDRWRRLFEALRTANTNLEILEIANCGLDDSIGQYIHSALQENHTLKKLTLDSNLLSPMILLQILKSISASKTITEFRCNNQVRDYIFKVYNIF